MDKQELLQILEERFNKSARVEISWDKVSEKLSEDQINSLIWMEETGGEPDLVELDGRLLFLDMSKETPKDRRSVCYDQKARVERKKNAPENSAMELCNEHGVNMLDEAMYRKLQDLGDYDLKTSSWLETPKEVRDLGGAIFGDKRYDRTFIYHNGADSYYSARAFRTYIEI